LASEEDFCIALAGDLLKWIFTYFQHGPTGSDTFCSGVNTFKLDITQQHSTGNFPSFFPSFFPPNIPEVPSAPHGAAHARAAWIAGLPLRNFLVTSLHQ
jgi:hypothetical protein